MKTKKLVSALTSAAVTAVLPVYSALAAEPESIAPIYQDFNRNDVNGTVTVTLPEGFSAKVSITFDSPECKAEPYYLTDLAENASAVFDIEGRDNSDNDYRDYMLTLTPDIDGVKPFTAHFNVPDGNDDPDSFREYTYSFLLDDAASEQDWEAVMDGYKNTITYHIRSFTPGDVDENGMVDAKDASKVLVEYSSLSTSGVSTLTENQKKAANVNGDTLIDAKDASRILVYYAAASTGGDPKWD